jgi:hypothetical protein
MLAKLKEFDFYRRIPKDLTESSAHGSALSMMALTFLLGLIFIEFRYDYHYFYHAIVYQ